MADHVVGEEMREYEEERAIGGVAPMSVLDGHSHEDGVIRHHHLADADFLPPG